MFHQRREKYGLNLPIFKKVQYFSSFYYVSNNMKTFFTFHLRMRLMLTYILEQTYLL